MQNIFDITVYQYDNSVSDLQLEFRSVISCLMLLFHYVDIGTFAVET